MKALVIDSCNDSLFVGLLHDSTWLSQKTFGTRKDADKNINRLVNEVLGDLSFSDINAYAVVTGPGGSWTGTRVGVVATLAYATAVPKPIIELKTVDIKTINNKYKSKDFTSPENLKPIYCSDFVVNAKR